MTAEPILVLAWLALAHLIADFVLQTTGIVAAKTSTGARAWAGLVAHGIGIAVTLVPVALAFGEPGVSALVAVTVAHLVIDRAKIVLTRRSENRALAAANRRHEGRAPAAGLGRAWTPMPAAYFALDQAAHLGTLVIAWAIWLDGQAPTTNWIAAVDGILADRPREIVHDVVLGGVVVASLLIANVRAAAIFVATLVRPLEVATDLGAARDPTRETETGDAGVAGDAAAGAPAAARGRRWSFRLGPLEGRVAEDPATPASSVTAVVAGERVALPPPAQVGATIGVIERLLIVAFMLVGADAAIGFVVGAKTIARFRQLDDRDFAEYYLLGTLASVSIAILTAVAARAALGG